MKLKKMLKIQVIMLSLFLSSMAYTLVNENVAYAAEARPELLTDSMSSQLTGTTASAIAVVPDPSGGGARKEYAGTLAGLQEAMFDIYQHGDGGNYGVYVGTNVTATTLTAETAPAVPSATNITFSALEGKAANLIFTSTLTDEITTNTTAAAGAKTVTFGANSHLGTGLVLRNISYSGTNIFMNGHDLKLGGNSYGNGLSIYGGANTADVTGSPNITVDSTGSGIWYFYGGNAAGGTLTGDVKMTINNTSAAVNTISGGAKGGTVKGNIQSVINDTKGTVTNINGGGLGTAALPANVEGNITTTIKSDNASTGLRFANFIGGVKKGDITGSIKNTVSGYGSLYLSVDFIGGSMDGNIGTDSTALTIQNNLDISKYTSSTINQFVGANDGPGTIRGNVENYLKSGPVAGATRINGINGLGGYSAPRLTQAMIQGGYANSNTTIDAYDQLSTEEKIAIVEKVAQFRVYGNVETWLQGGRMGDSGGGTAGFTKGAGYGGMVIGDSTIHVGTANADGSIGGEGFASTGAVANLNYSTSTGRGNSSAWDLVAGGGQDSGSWQMFKVGANNTIVNNAAVRWLYSGGGSGVYVGKNTVTLNGGFLDTLEGNGYMVQRHYGDTEAIINDGQVDWFATPGGWHNVKRIGNGKMTINGGMVNAHIGATYNESDVYGDSETIIKGGDFSGAPRTGGTKMFSGGPNNNGNLHGSSALTIDFHEYEGAFSVPRGTYITAGLANGSLGSLGASEADSATLNIYTKPGVDALNGATIYGTVGTAARNKIGSIQMNIDAPDSTIGDLLAWNNTNIASSKINKNVEVNIQRAKSIGTISGGNGTDNFTNTIVSNSPDKSAVFNVGVVVGDPTDDKFQTDPINVTSGGLINFTELNVDNGTVINAAGGNILNGGSATAANHGATYNNFGHLNIKNGGGIGVSSATGRISVGDVTVSGESKIESLPGTGIINLTSLKFADDESRFNWVKLTGGAATVASNGSYWGSNLAYQVLTFSPTPANASAVTPFNFIGIEKDTGKTFIGDNDVSKTPNGFGIAIPGSIIDYSVAEGVGEIFHDVSSVSTSMTPPITGDAWATYTAGTQTPKAQKGRLVMPSSKGVLPTLTSDPDDTTGMWIKNVAVTSTKVGSTPEVFPERQDDLVQNWKSPDANYSYTLAASFKNDAEISTRSKVLSLADVQAMTDVSDLEEATEVTGRPFLTSDLTKAKLQALQQELKSDEHRVLEVTYSVGYGTEKKTETVNIVVVGTDFVISDDGYYTIHTKNNVSVRQAVLAEMLDNSKIIDFYKDSVYVHGFGLSADKPETLLPVTPLNGDKHLTDLRNSTTLPTTAKEAYGITYSLEGVDKTLTKPVNITVTGNTSVVTVEFHNESNEVMPGYTMTIDKKDGAELIIGESIELDDPQFDIAAKLKLIKSAGYEVVKSPANSLLLDAEKITIIYQLTGQVYLSSAPANIDFGKVAYDAKVTRVDDGAFDNDLIVNDTRATKSKWILGAKLKTEMTSSTDSSAKLLESLQYVKGNDTVILNDGLQSIYQENDSLDKPLKVTNISDTWGTTAASDGIKLVVDPAKTSVSKGTYQGVIEWQFMEATP